MSPRWTAVALAAVALATLVSSDEAAACGNAVVRRVDPRVAGIAQAEQKGQAGDHLAALTGVLRHVPNVRSLPPSQSGVTDRAIQIAARAVARTGGAVAAPTFPAASESDRQESLQWAARVLAGFHSAERQDAVAASDLGEVWARLPGKRREAKSLLDSLEDRDLMSSAFGYVALARLRAGAAEGSPSWLREPIRTAERPGEILARARCRSMTKTKTICDERDEQAVGGGA